jgi:DNA polymerase I-like protein with 3'-5' exonuclease and polymerase domains
VVVECDAGLAEEAKAWLKNAMVEGMDAVMKGPGKARVPVGVEVRVGRRWGEGG